MPYIDPKRRILIEAGGKPENVGELNYLLTRCVEDYWKKQGESYQTYNDILGALEGAKLELYRTLIGPYETSKALINGSFANQPDRAWAAGFFDGEGNINHTLQRNRQGAVYQKGRMQITVTQKEPLLLLRFKEAVGNIGYLHEPTGQTTCWHYTISQSEAVITIIQILWPFLGTIKRKQALEVLRKHETERNLDYRLPLGVTVPWPTIEVAVPSPRSTHPNEEPDLT